MNIVHRISILSIGDKTEKRNSRPTPFIVINSDRDNGYYITRLLKKIRKYGLEEFAADDDVSLRTIEPEDILIFGESVEGAYDVRVSDDYTDVDGLDARRFKEKNVLDLVDDFDKVMKMVDQYEERPCRNRKGRNSSSRRTPLTFPVYAVVGDDFDVVCRPVVECWTKKKITIFNNWVKVGTDVYDIYVDLFGNEFIKYKGTKLFIHTNWVGQKYLSETAVV